MEFLIYLPASIVVFSGIFVGFFLSRMAFEELEDLEPYLNYLLVLMAPAIIFYVFLDFSWVIGLILSCLFLVALLLMVRHKKDAHQKAMFGSLGAVFFLSSQKNSFLMAAFLIFCFGVFVSTIFCHSFWKKNRISFERPGSSKKKGPMKKTLISLFLNYYYFLLVSIVFYLLFTYVI